MIYVRFHDALRGAIPKTAELSSLGIPISYDDSLLPSKRAHARYYDVVLLYVMYMMFFQTNGICEIS